MTIIPYDFSLFCKKKYTSVTSLGCKTIQIENHKSSIINMFFLYSALAEGTILDNHQLICLYMLSQLLERELDKCLRLVVAIPMDMSTLYGR